MASQSETLLSPSVIHPTRTVCLTQPEPATILIDDSDSEESIEENEPERAPINTRGRKRQREDEPQTRRKRLRTSMASEASSNSEEDVIDLTSDRDVIDVETAPSASRAPSTPMTTRNASYPPSHANPLNSLMRSFGMGQYHLPRIMLHHAYQPHPPAAAIDFLFSALPSSASLRSSSYGDYDYRPREPVENVEDRFGGGYWSRRRQQQLTRSSSSTGSSAQSGPVTVVDIDDDEPANRPSTSGTGSGASTRSPDKPNVTESTKPSAATVADLTKDLKCAICLGAIENITATVCGHIFCEGCILPAIEIQRKCPICRTPLTKKSIHPLFF